MARKRQRRGQPDSDSSSDEGTASDMIRERGGIGAERAETERRRTCEARKRDGDDGAERREGAAATMVRRTVHMAEITSAVFELLSVL